MNKRQKPRRLRILVSDEDTGEEVAVAAGVETMVLVVAPDTMLEEECRRLFIGDLNLAMQMLFDIVSDVSESIGSGTIMNLTNALDDHLLLELTDGLTLH